MKTRTVVPALAGLVLQNALTLGTGILIARSIGAAEYGITNLLRNLLQFALMLAPFGFDIALQKYVGTSTSISRSRVEVNRVRLAIFFISAIGVSTIPLGLGRWLNEHYYHVARLDTYLLITFVSLPMLADMAVLGGVMRGRQNPNPQIFASFYLQPVFRTVLVIAFLYLHFGVFGVILSNTLGSTLGFLFLGAYFYYFQDKNERSLISETPPPWRETAMLVEPALWMAVSMFFYSTIRNIDILILGSARPMKEVGEYGSLSTIAQFAQFVPLSLSLTLGPTIARLFSTGNVLGIRNALGSYLRISSLLAAPIFAAAAAWGPVLDLVFGRSFSYSPVVCALLPLGYFISGVLAPMGYGLSMTGKHRIEAAILITGNIFVVICCLLTAGQYGQLGVAASALGGYLLINFLRYAAVSRTLGIIPGRIADIYPPVFCLLIAIVVKTSAFAVLPRTFLTLIISGSIFGACVGLLYWRLLFVEAERIWTRQAILKTWSAFSRLSARPS